MIFVYWYFLIGVLVGCFITYILADKVGFESLFNDYQQRGEEDEMIDMSFETFKSVLCFLIPLMVAFTWPYFVYMSAKKYFR